MAIVNRRHTVLGAGATVFFCSSFQNAQASSTDYSETITIDGVPYRIVDIRLFDEKVTDKANVNHARSRLQNLLSDREYAVREIMDENRWGEKRIDIDFNGTDESAAALLVREGLAFVSPRSDRHEDIKRFLALEAAAIAERRGCWQLKESGPVRVDETNQLIGRFKVIDGMPRQATVRKGRFYLNFGEDYRTDFTVSARASHYKRWAKNGLDLATMANMLIRVRGHLVWINGPSIELTHPLQISPL